MTLYNKCVELNKVITGVILSDEFVNNRFTVSFRKIQNPVIDRSTCIRENIVILFRKIYDNLFKMFVLFVCMLIVSVCVC